jgi:NADPH:quinone reductase-like Zn-dependent oxidoreductase
MRAASLNDRDLMIARGSYPGSREEPVIPLSDGAGRKALGSPLDGTLAEQAVFHESGLIHTPDGLSREEAATLPCAGQTAWHALFGAGAPLQPGQTLLTLGTGGVSSFALLFGAAAGAHVIVTSSSDDKFDRARSLGTDETINYERTPDWHEAVLGPTNGVGADCVVEVGGVCTFERSFQAVAPEGKIGLIGVLSDGENPNPHFSCSVAGTYTGSTWARLTNRSIRSGP